MAKLTDAGKPEDREQQKKKISDMLESEIQLRSKKELIEKFIEENLPLIRDSDQVNDAFDSFWTLEKKKAIQNLSKDENLDFKKLVDVVSNYLFTEKEPLWYEVISVMNERPSLMNRATSSQRILTKIKDFIETFINAMG